MLEQAQTSVEGDASAQDATLTQANNVPETQVGETAPTPEKAQAHTQAQVDPRILSEMDMLRRTFANTAQENERMRQELEALQTASMSEEERQRYDLDKRSRDLQSREEQLAQMRYAQELYSYYSQFVPANAITGNDPADWQHSVLTSLVNENKQLKAQVASLRGSTKPGANAPKVGVGGGGKVSQKSVFDMTYAERQALLDRARMGDIRPEDYPGSS